MENFEKQRKILVSITTTKGSDWRARIREIDELAVKELAIFPTCLDEASRKEFYRLLENSRVENIPFVHIKNDMPPEDLEYLIKRFNAKAFNMHTAREYPFLQDYSKYRKMIFIENVYFPLDENEIKEFGGICLDFTHLENDRNMHPEIFKQNEEVLARNRIGCNHMSAFKITEVPRIDSEGYSRYDKHSFSDFSDFDYLKKYPANYFSPFLAIEVENSIKEQLEARSYIISEILSKK